MTRKRRPAAAAPLPDDDPEAATVAAPPPFDPAGFLPHRLQAFSIRLADAFAALLLRRFGVTALEWLVIAYLAANRRVSVREIHKGLGLDKVPVSRTVAALEAAGHLRKEAHAMDRRLVVLDLTPRGRRLHASALPVALAFQGEALSGLSEAEGAEFRRLLDKLAAAPDPATSRLEE